MFLLFFASLDVPSEKDFLYDGKHSFEKIPTKLIQHLSSPVPSLYSVDEQVKQLRTEVLEAKSESKNAGLRSNIALGLVASLFLTLMFKIFFPGAVGGATVTPDASVTGEVPAALDTAPEKGAQKSRATPSAPSAAENPNVSPPLGGPSVTTAPPAQLPQQSGVNASEKPPPEEKKVPQKK